MARLGRLRSTDRATTTTLQREQEFLDRIHGLLVEKLSDLDRIRGHIEAALDRILHDHAFGLLNDTLSAETEEKLRALSERLREWWRDDLLTADLDRWQDDARKRIEAWVTATQDVAGRRFASAEFRRAFPDLAAELNADAGAGQGTGARSVFQLLDKAARVGHNRAVVYQVGKLLGVKFKPWGAVKAAGRVAKFGSVLAAAGVVIDVYDLVAAEKAQQKRDDARADAIRFITETTAKLKASLLAGDPDEPGPVGYLLSARGDFADVAAQTAAEQAALLKRCQGITTRLAIYESLISAARTALGLDEYHE